MEAARSQMGVINIKGGITQMLNQKDKQLHFIAGLTIAFLFSPVISPFYALILAISAGLAKEIYDYFFQGNVEFMDFVVTLMGGLVGYLLFTIFPMF